MSTSRRWTPYIGLLYDYIYFAVSLCTANRSNLANFLYTFRLYEVTVAVALFVTRHSLVRAKGEVFVLLYVFLFFLFVRSTISRQPAGWFTPKFACERTLVPDVSSPLLGVSGPRRAEKWGNDIFVTIGVNGEFLHFGGFWTISQQRVDGSTPNFIYVGTMSADVPLPLWRPSVPEGRGEGELKNSKNWGWSHSCSGQLPFLFFSALPNMVQYVGHRPAHSLV